MAKVVEIVGEVYGRLTVLRREGSIRSNAAWRCRCRCGNEIVVRGITLRSGNTSSCGCLVSDLLAERNRRNRRQVHGHAARLSPAYRSWMAMNGRCRNPNDPGFHLYGGRGITICDRWRDFVCFLEDMGDRPPGTSIDRIDNDGNYEPGNCRWATPKQQGQRRRAPTFRTPRIVHCGEDNPAAKLTEADVRTIREARGALRDIGKRFGVSASAVCNIRKRNTWAHVE